MNHLLRCQVPGSPRAPRFVSSGWTVTLSLQKAPVYSQASVLELALEIFVLCWQVTS